eukprot:1388778-Pleurochrysis_carterae.AAC.1
MVAPQVVPGVCNVRWYTKAKVIFVITKSFGLMGDFLNELGRRNYGDAMRRELRAIYDNVDKRQELLCGLAAMLDVRMLVQVTYELERDGLEILLVYERIEQLCQLGRSLLANDDGVFSNLDAALRSSIRLERGAKFQKVYAVAFSRTVTYHDRLHMEPLKWLPTAGECSSAKQSPPATTSRQLSIHSVPYPPTA